MVDDNEGVELDVIELDQDLSDVEKPPELPPGVYIGQVQDVQVATSGKGNRYYAIKFVIPPEQIPADMGDDFPDGAALFWNRQMVPTPKDRRALYNLRKFVEALGLDAATTTIDPNEWMGREASLRVRHTINPKDPSSGKRAEIQSVEPAEGEETVQQPRSKPAPRGRQQVQEEEEETTQTTRGGRAGRRR